MHDLPDQGTIPLKQHGRSRQRVVKWLRGYGPQQMHSDGVDMTAPRTCRLVTLGCKVNQYETQYVKETLEANGYVEAAEGQLADLCIVNTCTVTAEGDAKSRQAVRRLHQAQPRAGIVVMGCYATRDPDTVARLPGVVKVIADKTRHGRGTGAVRRRRGHPPASRASTIISAPSSRCRTAVCSIAVIASSRMSARRCAAGRRTRSSPRSSAWWTMAIAKSC